jgi:hypothetical protein
MDTQRRHKLVNDFQQFFAKQAPNSDGPDRSLPEFWAVSELDKLVYSEPEAAWDLILELAQRDLNDLGIACLAAGPLEDLIQHHGPQFVERIEQCAHSDAKFRYLLGGVWESGEPEVWSRVTAVRGEVW